MSHLPGKGVFGWLGRQVGYVRGAIKADPAKGAPPATAAPAGERAAPPTVVYRDGKTAEVPHPTQPGVTLRRTIIDEVVVDAPPNAPGPQEPGPGRR